jgi:hypothetical protein
MNFRANDAGIHSPKALVRTYEGGPCVLTHMQADTHIYIQLYIHIYMYVHAYTRICTCNTHTHTLMSTFCYKFQTLNNIT